MRETFYTLISPILSRNGITLTDDQVLAVEQFLAFYMSGDGKDTFLMTGSAGTGKTLMIQLFTFFLKKMGWKVILLAPTGRAAKVITQRTKRPAHTIHHHIFSLEEGFHGEPFFHLKENKENSKVVYIIDEASMIGDGKEESMRMSLLASLLRYVFDNDENRKLIFIGDSVQLPPVNHTDSPALNAAYLKDEYELNVFPAHLSEVKRQSADSLVLENAVLIRDAFLNGEETPELNLRLGRDVQTLDNGYEALETYCGYYDFGNLDKVVFITYSNHKAMQVNMAIRHKLLETEEKLVPGDLVMVVKNNYTWGTEHFSFLANGEMGVVVDTFPDTVEELYGLTFMNVVIGFDDSNGEQQLVDCKVVLDLLQSKQPQLTAEQNYRIWQDRIHLYDALPKKEAQSELAKDPYLHALQLKYGYAITGHKAQGGQWQHAIIAFEPDYGNDLQAYIRWTYTVFTRATQTVNLLGCPFG